MLEKHVGGLEDAKLNAEAERRELELKLQEAEASLQAREAEVKKLGEKAAAPAPAAGPNLEAAKYARSLEEKVASLDRNRLALESELKKLKQEAGAALSGNDDDKVAAAVAEVEAEKTALEGQLAELQARLQAAEQRPAGSSKAPLFLGLLFLIAGLALAGVAIYQPALLDPLRSALNPPAPGSDIPGMGGK
jgi:hypothetical protein